jgi:hypothetical protein
MFRAVDILAAAAETDPADVFVACQTPGLP